MLKRLYAFGALMVYRVSYFDPVMFRTINLPQTFSEERAKETAESHRRSGFAVSVSWELVRFDGAFRL